MSGYSGLQETEEDGDNLGDERDYCPLKSNALQNDVDFEGVGDACDNCPDKSKPQQTDTDDNCIGNGCEPDNNYGGHFCCSRVNYNYHHHIDGKESFRGLNEFGPFVFAQQDAMEAADSWLFKGFTGYVIREHIPSE